MIPSTQVEFTHTRLVPQPECPADTEILEGLAIIDRETHFWRGDPLKYDWRAAQIASWSVPIGSCARCRRTVHWACWRWRDRGHCPYGCDRSAQ